MGLPRMKSLRGSDVVSNDACLTVWPHNVSMVLHPNTLAERRVHLHTDKSGGEAWEAMLGRAVGICLADGCTAIYIREEGHDD